MGVPDELDALDDDLAAGRLDAASYRRRRDELRALRVEPAAAPTEPAPAPDPFPPPFRWTTAPPGARAHDVTERDPASGSDGVDTHPPEITQVVTTPVARPEPPPERTQVVHTAPGRPPRLFRAGPEPTQVVRTGADPTQVVPGAALARTATTPAPPGGAPPWTSGTLQRRQGADLFVRGGPTPAVLVSTTLVVVVAALVVVLSLVLA